MENKTDVLESFNSLSEYLKKEEKIKNLNKYKKDFSAFLLHVRHLKAYDFIVPFCKDKRVLDIGCFLGYGEKIINSSAKEIIAIDIDDEALAFASLNYSSANVKFVKSDTKTLPFDNKSFDIILAFQLIEHIPPTKVIKFLEEARRVLKDDGLLFLTTPNRKTRLRLFQQPFNSEHYQEFTPNGLKRILKKIFPVVEVIGVTGEKWIREIERGRVKKSFYQSYKDSILRILPKAVKNILLETKSKMTKNKKPAGDKKALIMDRFEELFDRFSMKDFYLEKQKKLIDKSLDLLAICSKQ